MFHYKFSKIAVSLIVLIGGANIATAEFISNGVGSGAANPTTSSDLVTYTDSRADTDNDGVNDNLDAFPTDPLETTDTDGDGIGDNADAFPNDATESQDSDGDGVGDVADAFPNDASETTDTDGDGIGDNADPYPSNNLPVVFAAASDVSVSKGVAISSINVASLFSDANSDTLTYTVSGNPSGFTLSGSTFSGSSSTASSQTVTFTAADSEGSVSTTFDLVVTNTTPVVSSASADQSVSKGTNITAISLASVFSDADSDTLTYTVSGNPSGIAISGGSLSGSHATAGTYSIVLTATDTDSASVSDTVVVTVTNTSPTVASAPSDQTVNALNAITSVNLSSVFNDADGDSMTYTASGMPTGVTLSGSTLSGTTSTVGTHTITLTASDGTASASTSYDLTVSSIPLAFYKNKTPTNSTMNNCSTTAKSVKLRVKGGVTPYKITKLSSTVVVDGQVPNGTYTVYESISGSPVSTSSTLSHGSRRARVVSGVDSNGYLTVSLNWSAARSSSSANNWLIVEVTDTAGATTKAGVELRCYTSSGNNTSNLNWY